MGAPNFLTRPEAIERIDEVNVRLQIRLRATFAGLTGFLLMLESVNAEFMRSHFHFEAWTTMVNLMIALFGAAFLFQSWFLLQQLQEVRSKS
jgi:hypothetical protein